LGGYSESSGIATPLIYEGEQVGFLLKSKDGCRPIVVAPGHRVTIESSLELTRRYLVEGKLPEPCRLAHQYANQVKSNVRYFPLPNHAKEYKIKFKYISNFIFTHAIYS
jgi:deoxyribonuclease V